MTANYELIAEIEQFYYREARLLDERRYQQWLALVDESLEYTMPARYIPQPVTQDQDTEAFLAVEKELEYAEGGAGSPLREDNYFQALVRTIRPLKPTAWAESPPPRTRRFISNVELLGEEEDEYTTASNFQMFYSHEAADNHTYYGGRRDVLKRTEDGLRLLKREVITDWNIIPVPSLALIL